MATERDWTYGTILPSGMRWRMQHSRSWHLFEPQRFSFRGPGRIPGFFKLGVFWGQCFVEVDWDRFQQPTFYNTFVLFRGNGQEFSFSILDQLFFRPKVFHNFFGLLLWNESNFQPKPPSVKKTNLHEGGVAPLEIGQCHNKRLERRGQAGMLTQHIVQYSTGIKFC